MPIYDGWEQVVGETLVFSPVLRALRHSGLPGLGDTCVTKDIKTQQSKANTNTRTDTKPDGHTTTHTNTDSKKHFPHDVLTWDVESFVALVQVWLQSDGRLMEVRSGLTLTHAYFVEVDADSKISKVLFSG